MKQKMLFGTLQNCFGRFSFNTLQNTNARNFSSFRDRVKIIGNGEVVLSFHHKVAHILLSHPNKKNALSGKMMHELRSCVETLETWREGMAVVVTGGEHTFCSGADLSLLRDHLTTPEDGKEMCEFMTETLDRLRNLPLISVAALEGVAMGGGAEITTACDFRIATSDTKIQFVQVKIGLSPGWGGGYRLVKLIGRQNALKLLAASQLLTAAEAHSIGFVDHIFGNHTNSLMNANDFLAGIINQKSVEAVHAVKRAVAGASDLPKKEALLVEKEAFMSVWRGPANRAVLENNLKK